jgi:hypothetical protein
MNISAFPSGFLPKKEKRPAGEAGSVSAPLSNKNSQRFGVPISQKFIYIASSVATAKVARREMRTRSRIREWFNRGKDRKLLGCLYKPRNYSKVSVKKASIQPNPSIKGYQKMGEGGRSCEYQQ